MSSNNKFNSDNSTAYCRVYYDTTNLQRIISYLKSEEYRNIHVLNRAQIIDDAFAFLLEDQLDSSVLKNLISYLGRETDYVPWRYNVPNIRTKCEVLFTARK
ncbi:Aminopeptidase N [Temnothorax longispinosus]|uniref:Aminopeptidase N n=1 Tax=Temnothorax longispinosus TaxID=300112 RepID=A0A4S2KJW8_9HYME|nr:Aminopeptidase N [Temnothorax longispinosus]